MSPFTPDQFKYSFTVKYIGLLRQVFSPFNPLSMRSKIYCNGHTGLRDFAVAWTVSFGMEWSPKISLPLLLQGLHLIPISPGASSFSFSDMVQKLSRFDLDVKYDILHCISLIFHSASVTVNPTSRRSRTYDHTDPDHYSNTMIWASLRHTFEFESWAYHTTSSAASGPVALLFMT
jgi:hypothetical protein